MDLSKAFDIRSQAFIDDPYAIYKILQQHDPIHKSDHGFWVLTRYDHIVEAMADSRFSNEPSPFAAVHRRNRQRFVAADVANNILPFQDPPIHSSCRRVISKAFQGHYRDNPPNIDTVAQQLLAQHNRADGIDVMADFATPLTSIVIADVLGLPRSDTGKLKDWSHWFFYLLSVIPSKEILDQVNLNLIEFRDYLSQFVEHADSEPSAGNFISRLLNESAGDARLSHDQIVDTLMLLYADGVENSDSAIATALVDILSRPNIHHQLLENPELLSQAVDESLRLNPAGQYIAKIAKQDIDFHGFRIKRNEVVLLVLAAANRDPTRYTQPDDFILSRGVPSHLSFGKGRHSCLGATLVRAEMQVALSHLLPIPKIELTDAPKQWQSRLGHRWLVSLPVRFRSVLS